MVSMNPACYLPSAASRLLPSALSCPPPPSLFQSTYSTFTSPLGSTYTTIIAGMDALLSLPLFSFLLIPTMTSYSTSLNLLFFYLTWSTLILSHPPLRVEIVASLAIKVLFYVLPSALFLMFDVLVPGISESFKSLGSTALPMKNLSRRKTLAHLKTLAWSLFNVALGIALQASIEYTLVSVLQRKSALKVATALPLPWAILKDILRGLLARDLLTWLIHRYLLHNPHANSLTRDLTHLHTTWYHTRVQAPFPLSPTYDHPIIYILRIFLPIYVPATIWRFHLLTYILYLLLVSLEESLTHSGYTHIPTNFVLGGIARRNDMHCLNSGEGNFGTSGIVDWIMGTNVGGDVAEEIMMEVEEARVEEKVQRKVSRGVRRVRSSLADVGGKTKSESKRRTEGSSATRARSGNASASASTGASGERRSGDDSRRQRKSTSHSSNIVTDVNDDAKTRRRRIVPSRRRRTADSDYED